MASFGFTVDEYESCEVKHPSGAIFVHDPNTKLAPPWALQANGS